MLRWGGGREKKREDEVRWEGGGEKKEAEVT